MTSRLWRAGRLPWPSASSCPLPAPRLKETREARKEAPGHPPAACWVLAGLPFPIPWGVLSKFWGLPLPWSLGRVRRKELRTALPWRSSPGLGEKNVVPAKASIGGLALQSCARLRPAPGTSSHGCGPGLGGPGGPGAPGVGMAHTVSLHSAQPWRGALA